MLTRLKKIYFSALTVAAHFHLKRARKRPEALSSSGSIRRGVAIDAAQHGCAPA